MNELLKMMSDDMNIVPHKGEAERDFAFRVCYSALGMWCLKTACNNQNGMRGTSKKNQSQILGAIFEKFSIIFPQSMEKFVDANSAKKNFAELFRNIYEETGYLLTDENNNNVIANFGRGLRVGSNFLFFGYPIGKYMANGLGVYTSLAEYECELNELLIRDTLTVDEYVAVSFNELDFNERDINIDELLFFNPQEKYKKISDAWGQKPTTKFTIARKSEFGPYYRIIQDNNSVLFADEQNSKTGDRYRLVDNEHRRLMFALKDKYGTPIVVKCNRLDKVYSLIYFPAHLPNREYYLLMLLGWPNSKYSIFDKSKFLFRTEFLPIIEKMLNNLGVTIAMGGYNG